MPLKPALPKLAVFAAFAVAGTALASDPTAPPTRTEVVVDTYHGTQGRGSIPLAGEWQRPRGARMDGAPVAAYACLSRWTAGTGQAAQSPRGLHQRVLAALLRTARRWRPGVRAVLRPEAAAAVAARARHGPRSGEGTHRARSERARPDRSDRDRLVRALPRRQAGRGVAVEGWQRGRQPARVRQRDGSTCRRGDPARQFPDGRRRRRVGGETGVASGTRAIPARSDRRPIVISTCRCTSTGSAPIRRRTHACSATACRRSRRSSSTIRPKPRHCWCRCRTATAASLRTTSAARTAASARSRGSRTAWTSRHSAPTARCTWSASATRRAARSSSWPRASPTSPGRRHWSRPREDAIPINFFGEDPLCFVGDRLYVRYLAGGPSRLRAFTLDGKPAGDVPLPEVASVDEFEPVGARPALQRRDLPHAGPLLPPQPRPEHSDRTRGHQPGQVRRRRGGARVRHVAGRRPRAGQHHPQEGTAPRRQQSDAALRLRRLRHQPDARLPGRRASRLVRRRRRLRGRQHPRRRRVRRGVASQTACSPASRTCSTTSSRRPSCW